MNNELIILDRFHANCQSLQTWGYRLVIRETGIAVARKGEKLADAPIIAGSVSELNYFCHGVDTYHYSFAKLGVRPDPDDFKQVRKKDGTLLLLVAHDGFFIEVKTFPIHDHGEVEQFIRGFCFAAGQSNNK